MNRIILVASIAVLLSSCVSKKKFAELTSQYDECKVSLNEKDASLSKLAVKIDGLDSQLASAVKQNESLQNSLEICLANTNLGATNITKLLDEIDKSNAYIKRLVESKFKNDSLNLYISNSLKRSLSDLSDDDVTVTVEKGVVFISLSDKLLYKSGSYEVQANGEAVLAKVAKIVNDYKDYDVLVEGHTDTDPYRGSGVIKDNWDLSVLRATAVVRLLQNKFNVAPSRMTAGGRSEFVPKASNTSAAGKAENRRTVIMVLPKLDQFLNLMNQGATEK